MAFSVTYEKEGESDATESEPLCVPTTTSESSNLPDTPVSSSDGSTYSSSSSTRNLLTSQTPSTRSSKAESEDEKAIAWASPWPGLSEMLTNHGAGLLSKILVNFLVCYVSHWFQVQIFQFLLTIHASNFGMSFRRDRLDDKPRFGMIKVLLWSVWHIYINEKFNELGIQRWFRLVTQTPRQITVNYLGLQSFECLSKRITYFSDTTLALSEVLCTPFITSSVTIITLKFHHAKEKLKWYMMSFSLFVSFAKVYILCDSWMMLKWC